MPNKDSSISAGKEKPRSNVTLPAVGEPLDGRHYLDVVEEQQYSGKPFIKEEQDIVLEQGERSKDSRQAKQ